MIKKALTLLVIVMTSLTVCAQQDETNPRRIQYPPKPFFVPHWSFTLQGGGSYDVGEAKFKHLLSPAAQVTAGYQFTPILGARLAVSGWEAHNRFTYPTGDYRWNFIQPSADVMVNLNSLFFGWQEQPLVDFFAFAGVGVNYAFNNDDAERAADRYGVVFQKLWRDHRWNPVARGGLQANVRITDNIAIGAEVNANLLPDHFNSKKGKNDNIDWHFNALLGLKVVLGRSHGRTEGFVRELPMPQPVVTQPEPAPKEFVDVPVEKISFNVNIYYLINQSIIRDNQLAKLTSLINYLNEHPKAFIRVSGYADRDTGTPDINMRLSVERAQSVSDYLQRAGIAEWRIRRFAKGDKVQPYDVPEDNRVSICYVYDPDHPEQQDFVY